VHTRRLSVLAGLFIVSCGGSSDGPSTPSTPPTSLPAVVNGCPSLDAPQARRGEDIGGDTFQTFARPFFARYCLRCHSSTLTTPAQRSGAPEGFNWDVESSVRTNLERIRLQVGVYNTMPLLDGTDVLPTCDERRRIVRWIDAGAP
jgi:uncharacterized membrane protein